ncbi:translation initiation factor IF3-4, chloroplastic [Lotus japonicus]|uniref:translation initiation factor IF3-4, chloroplastic n=1 Tax=Lotus japonicus TaxID=34305 RepID=UPI00258C9C11|nr:translation initiation factor IF3-4, chloroplastic [Lotus japonicus]
MAGITSVPFKLFYTSTTPSPSSLFSSSDSKLFARFPLSHNPHSIKFDPLPHPPHAIVTSRYGGGGPRPSGDFRKRQAQAESEDEQALDLSKLKSATVRLIDEKQNMVGVVSRSQAIQMADDAQLDLVIVSPEADPPVVKIMDYSKYRYEQQKKKRDQQKKSAASRMDLKELKMGYNIDQHDYSVRLRAARKFLTDGDKVKVIVNLKGRENEFRNIAIELIKRFQNDVGELGTEEAKSFRDRNIFILLVPNKTAILKTQEPPKKKDKSAADEVTVDEVSVSVQT